MMAAERSEIRFGHTRIPYAIRRSGRRSTVSIFVDPLEGVLLAAPRTTPIERLDRLVHQKATWIVQRLRRQSDLPPPLPAREFVSGETFLYLGRQYRLRVETRGGGREGVVLSGGHLRVRAAGDHVRSALVAWYRRHAEARIPEHVHAWARKLGLATPSVLVREQRKRWGSCNARGIVRFNWRVVQLPSRLLDYVIGHELVHLIHADHTQSFWATLGRVMPDYELRREALRALGPQLEW
jgi:predicted metal-dependent hydrolase